MTDHELLLQFTRDRSQEAFARIVGRHIHWLHSAALRLVRDPGLAQDVTQAVFLVLAKKAPSLAGTTPLAPWLFRVLRYVAANARRDEMRRKNHELEAAAMHAQIHPARSTPPPEWQQLTPLLDDAVERLSALDRSAILLHYQQLPFTQVGESLGISEEAARKRVSRALEKLRGHLSAGKITLPAAILAALLLEQTTQAAPAALLAAATAAGTTAASATVTTLAQGALRMFLHAQLKLAAACAAAIVLCTFLGAAAVHFARAQTANPTAVGSAPVPNAIERLMGIQAPSQTNPEADRRAALAAGTPRPGPTTAQTQAALNAREKFLAIERFARLPADQQAKELPHFYRDLAVVGMNWSLMTLNSIPENILERRPLGNPSGNSNERWNAQLQQAVATLTPEQVADALTDPPANATFLSIGASIRTQYALAQNRKELIPLVMSDLDSADIPTFKRGASTVYMMELTECTERLVDVYLKADAESQAGKAETPLLKEARSALIWLKDPAIVRLLTPIVEKDPKTLVRHSVLFDGPLMGRPAEPLLLKLLESPDVEIREAATDALGDCSDPVLAKPIAKLAHDPDPGLHPRALFLAEHIPDDAFAIARPDLLPYLQDSDEKLRINAITSFAVHKDPAAGPPLLAFLKQEQMDRSTSNVLVIALGKLTNGGIHYDQFHWGPNGNALAITQLEGWIQQHPAAR